jgi:hypothetical protein
MVVQEDGKVIIAGDFTLVNEVPRNGLARINVNGSVDASWDPQPNDGAFISVLALTRDHLYIGGDFRSLGGLQITNLAKIRLSGTGAAEPDWAPHPLYGDPSLGPLGLEGGTVSKIAVFGNSVFVTGIFNQIGGLSRTNVAKLNTDDGQSDASWDCSAHNVRIPAGPTEVSADETGVYLAGQIYIPEGPAEYWGLVRVSLFTGKLESWALPDETPNVVLHSGTNIYLTGESDIFQTRGKVLRFIKATGGGLDPTWSAITNRDRYVTALAIMGESLYVATSDFTSSSCIRRVSISDGGNVDATWSPVLDERVFSLAANNSGVYAAGYFQTVNGATALGLVRLDPVTAVRDESFPVQVFYPGNALAIARQEDGKIIVGGAFRFAGGLPRKNLVRVNADGTVDRAWHPDPDGDVLAITAQGNDIFVAGSFGMIGGRPRNLLAKLNAIGGTFVDPGWDPQIDGQLVTSLSLSQSNLFVGGIFSSVGGQNLSNLAKLSIVGPGLADATWKPNPVVTEGFGLVNAMALSGTNLFVGGYFKSIGGQSRAGLAKVSTVGAGIADPDWNPGLSLEGDVGYAYAMALTGTNLYVGGAFLSVGGRNQTNLAKLSTLGNAFVDPAWNPEVVMIYADATQEPAQVNFLMASGTNLYVGGDFRRISGVNRRGLARLDVSGAVDLAWDPDPDPYFFYSAGKPAGIVALLTVGEDVYAGGGFTSVGGAARSSFAFLPVADAPILIQDTNSTIIVSRNPADGLEVTHFRITGITGGTLFQADGVTPVSVGDFITVNQGTSGLRFTAAPDAIQSNIKAVSALNDTPAGAGNRETLLDLSVPQPPVFSFSSATFSFSEDQTFAVLTVNKRRPGAASVNYVVMSGTAVRYDADAENPTGDFVFDTNVHTLTFTAQQTSRTISIPLLDDLEPEGDEVFTVVLTEPSNGAKIAYPGIAAITLVDDECPGQHGSFTNTVVPPIPAVTGALQVNIPAPDTAQWRLSGDPVWRAPGSIATGLIPGFHEVLFKPVVGFLKPERVTVQIVAGSTATFTGLYASENTNAFGDLVVLISPEAVATNGNDTLRGQWRVSGGAWQDSGGSLRLVAGFYLIEFKSVAGVSAPLTLIAEIVAEQTVIRSVAYAAETAAGPALPAVLSKSVVTSTPPYYYNGLLETEDGFGSGVVVKERVVLTAAHVLFDDTRLSYTKRVKWFLQKHRGDYEPAGQVPRGWYVFDGYAARRTSDNSPGISSLVSESFDAAALFFVGTNAADNLPGLGGYGGYLSSASVTNEWLLSHRLKMLVGYPLEGIDETNRGRMHATAPADISFIKSYPQLNNQVYGTIAIASRPGNSGGPLYVQADDGAYYPAAIYLGGGSQTLVRAIDEKVVCLINAAEISSTGGGNNTGGGVALWSPSITVDAFQVGFVRVNLGPTNAVRAGAAWRVNRGSGDESPWLSSSDTVYPLIPGPMPLEFKPVPGFATPKPRIVQPVANSTVPVDVVYPVFRLSSPSLLLNGLFSFTLTGATGRVYAIESSADLTHWSMLVALTNRTGTIQLTNQPLPDTPWRFYRGRELP